MNIRKKLRLQRRVKMGVVVCSLGFMVSGIIMNITNANFRQTDKPTVIRIVESSQPIQAQTISTEPLAAQWQAGNVDVLIADWNEPYFNQLESFPESKFKDMVDASSSAFIEIENGASYSAPGTDNLGKNSYWRK